MKLTLALLSIYAAIGVSHEVWAQTSTATGRFLGQPVSPVMAVELDAAPVRAMPSNGTPRASEKPDASSAGMYKGVANAQTQGNTSPRDYAERKANQR